MKIVFFSDAHGNQYAVRKFFNEKIVKDSDLIVFGGDVFGYYYGAKEILSLLQKNNVYCILGNHDKMFLDLLDGNIELEYLVDRYGSTYQKMKNEVNALEQEYIRSWKSMHHMKIDGLNLVFVHGTIDKNLEGRIYPDTIIEDETIYKNIDYVFGGHTHHKMMKRAGDCTIVNPGSIGQQRDGKGCSYTLFDTKTREVEYHVVDYDVSQLIFEIERNQERKDTEDRLIEVLVRKSHE